MKLSTIKIMKALKMKIMNYIKKKKKFYIINKKKMTTNKSLSDLKINVIVTQIQVKHHL